MENEKVKHSLIAQAYRTEIINRRQPVHTKTRAERQGGGAKPWRQKGTGKARHGSIRSPIWRKGGVVFGPRKNHKSVKRINRKMKKKALSDLITIFRQEKRLVEIDRLPKSKKTRDWEKYLAKLPIRDPGQLLLVLSIEEKDQARGARNIPYLTVVDSSEVNIANLLNYDYLIMTGKSKEKLSKRLEI